MTKVIVDGDIEMHGALDDARRARPDSWHQCRCVVLMTRFVCLDSDGSQAGVLAHGSR